MASSSMTAPTSSSYAQTNVHAYAHYPEGLNSSPQWTAHSVMPSSSAMDSGTSSKEPLHRDTALTSSPHSRTTGLPSTVSSSNTASSRSSNVAISSPINNSSYINSCHNAGSVLNQPSSPYISVTRSSAQSASEPSVPTHSSNNVLIHSSTRPRTSNQVFASTTDLAAHYGIPTTLPPLPSINKRRPVSVTQPPSHSTAVPDFNALKANYLNMLSEKSESAPAPLTTDMSSATVSPADLQQPIAGDFSDLEGLLRSLGNSSPSPLSIESHPSSSAQSATAQSEMSFEPNEFLTSPWTPSLDAFGDSPGETPLSEFLNTPLIDDGAAMFTDPLFPPESPLFDATLGDFESSKAPSGPSLDASELLTFSPTSPNLDDTLALNPSHLVSPSVSMGNAFPAPSPANYVSSPAVQELSEAEVASRRRASATGTRKNVTVDSLVPLDAPTQPRRYLTPSATSKKDLPAVFARKRARQQMLDGEEDELECEPLKPNATELEQIEWKRRQNTLAARKSRKRKLQHQQELETQVNNLAQDREKWRQRALTLQGILQANGIPFADFQD
ncbi:hypothetical protein D9756_009640 [Leucocoprinus leucothites]|uniref:BZIP domain-containing protein n=1 Tax=Leucocoprinus leucothites TaxID=201217 RepID=A0A8H5CV33_9AGAR|nr:hypothetical protein D9756_009640 [Leucoagaricus leucothites]